MARRLTIRNRYAVSADRLFAMCSDLDVLEVVCSPWILFEHLPSGPVQTGQRIDVALSMWGILPAQPYSMHILRCDPEARVLCSEENGAGVERLVHHLRVEPDGDGAVLIDEIEIEAGWKTGFMLCCARFLMRSRHRKRLKMLAAGNAP